MCGGAEPKAWEIQGGNDVDVSVPDVRDPGTSHERKRPNLSNASRDVDVLEASAAWVSETRLAGPGCV